MKTRAISYLLISILSANALGVQAAVPASDAPVTLTQCYEWARERSEDLRIRAEDVKQAEARGRSALSSALPNVAWKLTNTWNDPAGVEKQQAQGFSGFVEKEQTESKFTLEQPLFSGLSEFSAVSGFNREKARNALRLERASFELFERVATAFYDVVGRETEWENTEAAFSLAEGRVKELSRFLRLGKSRKSEVYTAKARAAALKAQLDQIQAMIRSSREELSFLTAQDLTAAKLQDDIGSPPVFGTLEDALGRAKERTDVRAQREEVAALKRKISYEKGDYWPRVDLFANYYTQRATFMKDIDWDVVLAVDVPIYQGGAVKSRVREAQSVHRQAQLALEELERRVSFTVRKTYGELVGAVQETKSLEEAARAARESYDELREEYELGLVTNLDVLQALDLLQEQQSARDAARLKTKKLFLQLNVAIESAT